MNPIREHFAKECENLVQSSLIKNERVILGHQGAQIQTDQGRVLNLCANNYLGFSGEVFVQELAKQALDQFGFGLSSVRFICGTQSIHKDLEKEISNFLNKEDTILFGSCFDANGGVFEALLGEEDAVISDELNHASLIDGIRLCKAKRYRYKNRSLEDLEKSLQEAKSSRFKLIVTDGVFSMDGTLAPLDGIVKLAKKYGAEVLVDDSHAFGFIGRGGRGTPWHFGVEDEILLITGTLGKALGGASGGYVSGPKSLVTWLRNRARPYLFSNSLAPAIAGVSLELLRFIQRDTSRMDLLWENTNFFRQEAKALGLPVMPGETPIIPILLEDAALATRFAQMAYQKGVYVIGFSYPVVPMGKARIRTQISAGHSIVDLKNALKVFAEVGSELGILKK